MAKLAHIAHRWILAVPVNDLKKAVVKALDYEEAVELYKVTNNIVEGGHTFSLVHFTDTPGFENKVVDTVYKILSQVYQADEMKQTEV